jgi:hypothetical protein
MAIRTVLGALAVLLCVSGVWTDMLTGESEETSSAILRFAARIFPETRR